MQNRPPEHLQRAVESPVSHQLLDLAPLCLFSSQVELKSGEMYRGEMHEAEDNWNIQLSNVTATARDGKVSHMEHIFIRGSRVRFVIVPDMLKNAPMFKRIDPKNKMKNVPLGVGGRGRGAPAGGRGGGRF
jgi:small nuclear ribonucleoprotein D3